MGCLFVCEHADWELATLGVQLAVPLKLQCLARGGYRVWVVSGDGMLDASSAACTQLGLLAL